MKDPDFLEWKPGNKLNLLGKRKIGKKWTKGGEKMFPVHPRVEYGSLEL